ncbi:MAG: cation:proton antiporter [Alphaproteobacteria bacterium]|nr:cation:proton antiporter [Alphaproteobacteria bacterium]
MEADHGIPHLREIVVFLAAAGIVVPVFHRLRISPVLGFLLIGIAIGPYGAGALAGDVPWLRLLVIADPDGVRRIAELGVVFLLFTIGLELSARRLYAMRHLVFGLGGGAVAATALAIGAVAWACGLGPAAAAMIGLALAMSSTAVVMQLLAERRAVSGRVGRTAFAILLFQDLAVVPILVLVSVLGGDAEPAPALALAFGKGLAVVAAIAAVGYFALRPALRSAAAAGGNELFTAVVLLLVIGTAAATWVAGLSMALGAFLAGLMIADTEYRHEIEVDIDPFKGLLLGLFFIAVGMRIDAAAFLADPWVVLMAVAGLYLAKAALIGGLARLVGLPWPTAVTVGLLLGQGGEFALVAIGLAAEARIVEAGAAQFCFLVAGLSLCATPPVAALAWRLSSRLAKPRGDEEIAVPPAGHVLLGGFGRVGRIVADVLDREGIAYVALDLDPAAVERERQNGRRVHFGDASRAAVLERAGAESAEALVVILDRPAAAERAVASARRRWPDLPIYARARDLKHAERLRERGATEVIEETLEPSLQLAGLVMAGLGVRPETVAERIAARRDQTGTGDG